MNQDCNQHGEFKDSKNYHIQIALDDLNFQNVEVSDPIMLGRQILTAGGLDTRDDLCLIAIMPSGDFEDIRLDESFDLRGRGLERFIALHTDCLFKFTLDDRELLWAAAIRGHELYTLGMANEDQAVFLEVRGGTDVVVEPEEVIDLTKPNIERFITAQLPVRNIEIIINGRQRTVQDPLVTFEQIAQLAFPGAHGPNVVFSITYRKAASNPCEGELGVGGNVKVKTGTIFNVTRTDKS